LRDPTQEEKIMKSVRAAAAKYELKQDLAELVFRWIIDQTLTVEVEYLQGVPRP